MHMQKLFNLAISFKSIKHLHPTLEIVIDYAQKIEREFLHVEGIQQTEFGILMPIDVTAGND